MLPSMRSYRYLPRVEEALADRANRQAGRRGCGQTQGRVGCSLNDAARLNFNGDRNICTPRPNWAIVAIRWWPLRPFADSREEVKLRDFEATSLNRATGPQRC